MRGRRRKARRGVSVFLSSFFVFDFFASQFSSPCVSFHKDELLQQLSCDASYHHSQSTSSFLLRLSYAYYCILIEIFARKLFEKYCSS